MCGCTFMTKDGLVQCANEAEWEHPRYVEPICTKCKETIERIVPANIRPIMDEKVKKWQK